MTFMTPHPPEGTSSRCKLESKLWRQGALEEDEEQAKGDTKEMMTRNQGGDEGGRNQRGES